MVNWYFPLYLGVIFILVLFPYFASVSRVRDYQTGTQGLLGLSLGTNLVLAHLISGDTILFATLAVLNWGILGGVAFTFIELLSLLILISTVLLSRKQRLLSYNLLDFLQQWLPPFLYWIVLVILALVCWSNMVVQLLALKYLLGQGLQYSYLLSLIFISCFAFIWAGLGGFTALSKGMKVPLYFVFFTTVLLTIAVFLEKGIHSAYSDLSGLGWQNLNNLSWFLLLLLGIVFRLPRYLLNNSLWQITYQIRPHRLAGVLWLSLFCYLSIPLAYGGTAVFALSQGVKQANIGLLLQNLHFAFLIHLYVTTVFIAVITTYALNLYGLVSIYLQLRREEPEEKSLSKGYLFGFLMVVLCLLFTLLLPILSKMVGIL